MAPSSESLLSVSHLTPETDPDHPFSSWPSIAPNPIGRLVLVTPDVTAAAAKEIKTGKRFPLDYPVYPPNRTFWGRLKTTHELKCGARYTKAEVEKMRAEGNKEVFYNPSFDDLIHMNTQGTTQWDYFLHYSYANSGLFYGGLTQEEIQNEKTGEIGVAAIAKAGGVQTRAILLDIPHYLASNGLPPLEPFTLPSSTTIDVELLKKVIAFEKVEPRVGDVLIVRTGFEDAYNADPSAHKGKHPGVQPCKETIEWIWENGFVAVGSDNPTFEEWKYPYPHLELHPVLLGGMGIMIGELLRLNDVAAECQKQSRWSFYISSQPLMVEHGIASPPNAVAIF